MAIGAKARKPPERQPPLFLEGGRRWAVPEVPGKQSLDLPSGAGYSSCWMEQKGTRHVTVAAGRISQISRGGTPLHPKPEVVLPDLRRGRDIRSVPPSAIAFVCDRVIGTLP
jgi:hypothetical protein